MLHAVSLVIVSYVLLRVVPVLPKGRGMRVLLIALLCVAGLKLQAFALLFGGLASPELPRAVQLVWGWAHGAFILFAGLILLRDVLLLLRHVWCLAVRVPDIPLAGRMSGMPEQTGTIMLFRQRRPTLFAFMEASDIVLRQWLLPALLLACVSALWGVWQACAVPEVRTVNMLVRQLPAGLEGLRVVQLSDMHVSALLRRPWVEAVVRRVNELQPDIIVLTGDMVDGKPDLRAQDVAPLAELRAHYGVWACLGNHEYYADVRGWQVALRKLGIQVLRNAHVTLTLAGGRVTLAGVTDRVALRWPERALPAPDAAEALRGAPQNVFTLLLAHRPAEAEAASRAGVDLQLSGHTHGGQLWGLAPLVGWFNGGFSRGEYVVNGMNLYISNGAGLWPGFPLRVGVPSEITEVVLHSDN